MDFVEGIGRQYLQRKANAVPQQLENLARKQFNGDAAGAKSDSAGQNAGKDKGIEKLRRELAETKRGKGKPDDEVVDGRALADVKAKKFKETKSPERSKSTPTQPTKSATMPHGRARPQDPMHERHAVKAAEAMSRIGRSSSVQTAPAAKKRLLEHEKHAKQENNQNSRPTKASTSRHLPATNHKDVAAAPAYRDEQVHKIVSRTISEAPRPATNLFLVEVIDDESQRRQRANRSGCNIVEVIEKDTRRTMYVVR
ncbi:MAG: hypothetical protein Q9196_007163 [Gyalolechia fulgens]